MLNDLYVQQCEQFYAEHGAHVCTPEDTTIFADGATVENSSTGYGQLQPPSQDAWTRTKTIERYWLIVAQNDEEQFLAYQSYLRSLAGERGEFGGRGVPGVVTEEQQIAHLKMLQTQCKRSRAKYYKARRDAEACKPFWIEEREQADIEESQRKNNFKSKVESINI